MIRTEIKTYTEQEQREVERKMNYNEQEKMVERVEQNIQECQSDEGFDWEEYQYLCDIAEYWDCEE